MKKDFPERITVFSKRTWIEGFWKPVTGTKECAHYVQVDLSLNKVKEETK